MCENLNINNTVQLLNRPLLLGLEISLLSVITPEGTKALWDLAHSGPAYQFKQATTVGD